VWRGACVSDPKQIASVLQRHPHDDVRIGVETGPMSPWLAHGLRSRALQVVCLDARQVRAVLKMRLNKTDENDAEGLAQVMRMGWYRPVHVKSFSAL
jgi:transposase